LIFWQSHRAPETRLIFWQSRNGPRSRDDE